MGNLLGRGGNITGTAHYSQRKCVESYDWLADKLLTHTHTHVSYIYIHHGYRHYNFKYTVRVDEKPQ